MVSGYLWVCVEKSVFVILPGFCVAVVQQEPFFDDKEPEHTVHTYISD